MSRTARRQPEEALPRAAAPFLGFARLLHTSGFPVAPEQTVSFMRAVALLGPRSMEDIRQAALATLVPAPDRRAEFDSHFHAYFYGVMIRATKGGDDEVEVKDHAPAQSEETIPVRSSEGGPMPTGAEQLGMRAFTSEDGRLLAFGRALPAALPTRRSFRSLRHRSRGSPDLRRSLREIARADGDIPDPFLRRRQRIPRRLLILIDVSGSMKEHTADHLKVAHTAVQAAPRCEVFTFGTRLTRVTPSLRVKNPDLALGRAAAQVDDWDGGTRIGPTLLAFLSVPRFSALARGAAVIMLSDGLERGDHREMELALRRLGARAFRLSLCTPLASDPRFRPQTAALKAVLPLLDDLVDGSSVAALTDFILSLGRPAPAAAMIWREAS